MKLLFLAAIRNGKHLALALFTLFSLLFLTAGDLMERLSLGLIANTGADFFTLFEAGGANKDRVSKKSLDQKWLEIDRHHKGYITKRDATHYISTHDSKNPLKWAFHKISSGFDIEKDITLLIIVLVSVALYKAIMLFVSRYATQLLATRITRDLRYQYFEHIQSLPMSFCPQHNMWSLSARVVGDSGQIVSSLNSCLTN